jgi:hypothetical protein
MYHWIGIFHIVFFPTMICLFLVCAPRKYHAYIFVYSLLALLGWVVFQDECWISYLYKSWRNPSYRLGDSSTMQDIVEVYQRPMYIGNMAFLYALLLCYFVVYDIVPFVTAASVGIAASLYFSALYWGSSGIYGNGKHMFRTNPALKNLFTLLKFPYAVFLICTSLNIVFHTNIWT